MKKTTRQAASTYQNYIYEVIEQLKENYEETIADHEKTDFKDEYERGLSDGIKHGYYVALEKLRNQAQGFLIPLAEIGLEDEIYLM